MSSVLAGIKLILAGDGSYAAALGVNTAAGAGIKLYIQKAPQGQANPYAVINQFSKVDINRTKANGSSAKEIGVQHSVYHKKYGQADNLANLAETALDGFSGTSGTTLFTDIRPAGRVDLIDPDTGLHHIAKSFNVLTKI